MPTGSGPATPSQLSFLLLACDLQMRTLCHLEGHSDRVTRVSCNGDSILSGSFDTQVNLWTF